ncbi:MAG: hypothetical protein QXH51_07905 [Candidatus Bathyarchaeia archaeon]
MSCSEFVKDLEALIDEFRKMQNKVEKYCVRLTEEGEEAGLSARYIVELYAECGALKYISLAMDNIFGLLLRNLREYCGETVLEK